MYITSMLKQQLNVPLLTLISSPLALASSTSNKLSLVLLSGSIPSKEMPKCKIFRIIIPFRIPRSMNLETKTLSLNDFYYIS